MDLNAIIKGELKDLRGADLRDADLSRADLSRAVLCDCNLDGAKVSFCGRVVRIRFEEVADA